MANYLLKPMTNTSAKIVLGRKEVGFVRQITTGENTGKWVGRIENEMVIQNTQRDAFYEIVAVRNRIALCGVNDRAKATEALHKKNERVAQQARKEVEEFINFSNDIFGACKDKSLALEVFAGLAPRVKKRRIHI